MSQLINVFRWAALAVICVIILSYFILGVRLIRPVDVFTALRNNHETIRSLLTAGAVDSRAVWELTRQLEAHHKAEEDVLFSALQSFEGHRKGAQIAVEEHHFIDLMLAELSNMPRSDERWNARYEVVREYVEHHLQEEENEIFPAASELFDEKARNEMGARFERQRRIYMISRGTES